MKVKSSLLDEILDWREVAPGKGQFDVKFPNGKYYRYYDVPQGIYEKLVTATPSIGRFFDLYIKKANYKYEDVTNLYGAPAEGQLIVGTTGKGEVVINHPDLKPDKDGVGYMIFSPMQARNLAALLNINANDAEKEKQR